MTPLADIRAFFAAKLKAYQATNVAWENVPFDPATPSYLQFNFVQTSVEQAEYGTYGRDLRKGFVQITVYEPAGSKTNDDGSGVALAKAEAIEGVFHRGLSGTQNGTPVEVYRTTIGPAMKTSTNYAIPVTIEWRTATQPIGV